MNIIIIIVIIVIAIIAAIGIFAVTPSETWEDQRTGFTGVASPNENKEKIECLSNGGIWEHNGCTIEKGTETQVKKIQCSGSAICVREKVIKIIDGDTIYSDSYKIRLSLVDTPEKGEVGYAEATSFTAMSCPVGSMILVDQDDGQLYDEFGRLLGKIHCENGIINEILLQNGHAKILTQYCMNSEFIGEDWAQDYGCKSKQIIGKVPQVWENCDSSYPSICLEPGIDDLDCSDIAVRNFQVTGDDPHGFDGDKDGVGCES